MFNEYPPALICTSGPASAAAIRWMERCIAASGDSCMLYYSGDFDVKGLSMGQTLAGRFPGRFVPWRFDADTYVLAMKKRQGPSFDESDLIKLTKMNASWDERLCAAMIRCGCKIHHESVVEALVDDMWFGGRD
jgi:uncharacterized protein (TIGR02679 family)